MQEWVGIQFEDFRPADKEHVNTAQMVELVLRNHHKTSWFIRRNGVTCENRTQRCPCTTGIQQCVCV